MQFSRYMLKLISFLLLLIGLSVSVLAFGISPPSLDIIYEGVEVIEYEVRLLGGEKSTNVEVIIIGDMAEFIIPEKYNFTIPIEGTSLKYTVNLPEEVAPGKHKSVIVIQEAAVESDEGAGKGNFQLRSALGHVVKVYGTADQKYTEVSFDANNVNLNEKVVFKLHVKNLGGDDVELAKGLISIIDPDGNVVKMLNTSQGSYYAGMEGDLFAHWTPVNVSAGRYLAKLEFNYDGIISEYQTEFMVGDVYVQVVDLVENNLTKGGILPIHFNLKNYWSEDITTIYAQVATPNITTRTSPTDLKPFGSGQLRAYIDTNKMNSGLNEMIVELNYAGKTDVSTHTLFVLEKEKDYTTFYIMGLIIVVMLLVVYIFRRKV